MPCGIILALEVEPLSGFQIAERKHRYNFHQYEAGLKDYQGNQLYYKTMIKYRVETEQNDAQSVRNNLPLLLYPNFQKRV